MGSAAGQPNYGIFEVIKGRYEGAQQRKNVTVDLKGKVLAFNYYESLYSPMVTASFVEVDTGGTVGSFKDDFASTFKDGLPVTGFEQVRVKVYSPGYTAVNWTKKDRRFVITGSPFNVDEGTRQTAYFPMISKNYMDAASKPVKSIYPEAKISDIVKKMLDEAKLPYKKKNIEPTENSMKLDGKNENVIDTILKLCPQSVAIDGDPGFFFYENSEGFNFKSIHRMIVDGNELLSETGNIAITDFTLDRKQIVENAMGGFIEREFPYADEHTYVYKKGLVANLNNSNNDFNILTPPTVRRDQDVLNAIKNGQYNVRVCTRNLATGEVKEEFVSIFNNDKLVTLGSSEEIEESDDNDQTDSNNYCRTYMFELAPGATVDGVSESTGNSPDKWLAKSIMRYSLLHAQLVNIIVPCNPNLSVGHCVRLNFENITQDNKIEKELNEHRSGNYLIIHLCHAFTPTNSFTSLTVARDEYGLNRKI